MPADDDGLPAFAPQWLRAASSQKASLAAGVGNQAHSKDLRSSSSSGFASIEKDGPGTPLSSRRPSEKGGGWTSPSSAGSGVLGKARSPGVGARQAFRTSSLDTVGSSREKLIYKEDDEARLNFSGRFSGPQPNRTTSLDSPGAGLRREWEDPAPKNTGPRTDRSAGPRRDAGGGRVRPDSARAGGAWGAFEKEFPTLGPRPGPGREFWQSPVQEPASGRSDTEQWTSRLADVVPPTAATVSPLLPATGTGAAALAASASAPHTPRMADAVQQGARESAAASAAEVLRREQAAVRQSKQLVPIIAQSLGSSKVKPKAGLNGVPAQPSAKSLVHLNGGGGLSKKSSLEALGRAGSQPLQEGNSSSLVDLASLADRPASAAAALHNRTVPAATPAGTAPAATSTIAAPRSPARLQGVARERNRNDFFDSLRRKSIPTSPLAPGSSCGKTDEADMSMEQPMLGTPAQPVRPQSAGSASREDDCTDAGTVVKSTDASDPSPDKTASSAAEGSSEEQPERLGENHPLPNGSMSGGSGSEGSAHISSSPASKLSIPAEEEAFLRSLGWEESDDHNEGGLTEEEIAAFQAKAQSVSFKQGLSRRTRLQTPAKPYANGIADSFKALTC
ncbi:g7269 [Coccomyxa elongata]